MTGININPKNLMDDLVFNYFDEKIIKLSAPKGLISRIQNCIENDNYNISNPNGSISIKEASPFSSIKKDNSLPYSFFKSNYTKPYSGRDYYRYGTKTKTIWKINKNFKVLNYLKNDESSALICLRSNIYNCSKLNTTLLIHGSLISKNNQGILICGNSRSGKTSLMLHFLEKYGADFVSDESVLVSFEGNSFIGRYVPKTIRVRFGNIVNSPLDYLLSDYNQADATQYIDDDAIQNIIFKKAFHVDAGLAISRKQLVKTYGVCSKSTVKIERIIFPEYQTTKIPKINRINEVSALSKLEAQLRKKKTTINPIELEHYNHKIDPIWVTNILVESIQFNDPKSLDYVQF